MTSTDPPLSRPAQLLDTVADRSVIAGYSRIGYRVRRRHWPADDPAPAALKGRTALVTGANSGLGQATAAGLARLGATVVMMVRDPTRGTQAREDVLRQVPDADLVVARCDVADLDDVARAACESLARWPVVDVLVHNAGVLPTGRSETPQGHELTLATHVLGPLAFTDQMRPALAASQDARVIWVSSGGMYTQPLPAGDLEYRRGRYRGAVAYARTKRLQVALTGLLDQRYAPDHIGVHCTHPGWADTPGVAGSLPGFRTLTAPLLRTPAEGADTTIWLAATQPAPPSGRFWHDRRPRPTHYLPGHRDDPEALHRAWRFCRAAAGLDPDRQDGDQ
ncbi:MAG: SDR family NAD(P)-dependent oxidoreductase [Sciscionella sp.]